MATVSIVIGNVNKSVPQAVPVSAEAITSTGSSQQSSNSVPAADLNAFWIVTVIGGNVWVKAGSSPTAAAGDVWLISDGQTREWKASAGDKLAVIDA